MWFRAEPQDLHFTETAPYSIRNEAILTATPEVVFDVLADPTAWPRWFDDILEVHWTTDPPHGVGSGRQVKLKQMTVRERFLAFERGRRFCFTVEAITLPLVKGLIEDYQLEPFDEAKSRLVWTVYYRPRTLLRPIQGLIRPIFERMFTKAARSLARYLAESRQAA